MVDHENYEKCVTQSSENCEVCLNCEILLFHCSKKMVFGGELSIGVYPPKNAFFAKYFP